MVVSDDFQGIISRLIGPDGVSFEGILARAAHAGCPSEGLVRTILNRLVMTQVIYQDGMVYYPCEPDSSDLSAFTSPHHDVELAPEPIVVISVNSKIKRSSVSTEEREILRALESLMTQKLIRVTADGRIAANYLD